MKAFRPSLSKLSKSIALAVPLMTVVRSDSLRHCYEASAIGALILRKYGYAANAIPVDVIVGNSATGEIVTLGSSSQNEIRDRLIKVWGLPSDITPTVTDTRCPDGLGHAVIVSGNRIIDATIGQVNQEKPGHLLNVPGITVEAKLGEIISFNNPAQTQISWHAPDDGTAGEAMCRKTLQYVSRTRGGYYHDCLDAVRSLLKTNLDAAEWFGKLPADLTNEMDAKLRSLGVI